MLAQQIVNGITTGTLYGLFALGLVLVYRASDVINFAQGEMATVSLFVALTAIHKGASFVAAVALALLVSVALAAAVEWLILRRFVSGSQLRPLIATVGLLSIFNGATGLIWGYIPEPLPNPFEGGTPFMAGSVVLSRYSIITLSTFLVLCFLLYGFFRFTHVGVAVRAIAENAAVCELLGIPVRRLLTFSWCLAGVLGAITAVLVAPITYVEPDAMFGMLVYGLTAAIVGGLDNPLGVLLGGGIVGVFENIAGAYVSSGLRTTLAFTLVLVVLLVRPTGILGRKHVKKV